MTRYLCITATLLTGRYHGAEWPPSPARLVKALIAGAANGRYRRQAGLEQALRWLESQAPPEIIAPRPERACPYQLSVPNNDSDALARGKKTARELCTLKSVRPKVVSPPQVHYLWPLTEAQEPELSTLVALTGCLHALGWGIDMASANTAILDESAKARLLGEHFVPVAEGGPLRLEVPVPGFIDDVRKTFERFTARHSKTGVNPDVRPMVYGLQPYRVVGSPQARWSEFCLGALHRPGYFAVHWRKAMEVAAWLRHATAEAMKEEGYSTAEINRFVLGHPEDTRDRGRHLSFTPLPSIGHRHSDGSIRRALVVEPPDSAGELAELLQIKLAGHILTDAKARPICILAGADNQSPVWRLYCGKSRLWRSVTPVVLHGHATSHGKLSLTKLERLVIQAFERGGYSSGAIETISVQQAPFWAGTEGALRIAVPAHLARWPRYHVQVRFHAPVNGPVHAGIGRHFGIGVFATAPEESG